MTMMVLPRKRIAIVGYLSVTKAELKLFPSNASDVIRRPEHWYASISCRLQHSPPGTIYIYLNLSRNNNTRIVYNLLITTYN